MSTALRVDAADPTPPYEQLRRQIAFAVASGALTPGTRLPTVRQLASDLGVAPGTVMRVYAELESAGLVKTARGAGTVVAASPRGPRDQLAVLAGEYVDAARRLGATDQAALEAVHRALAPRPDAPNGP